MQDPLKHMFSAFGGTKAWAGNTCQQTSNFTPPDIPLIFTCGVNVTGDSTGDNKQTCSAKLGLAVGYVRLLCSLA